MLDPSCKVWLDPAGDPYDTLVFRVGTFIVKWFVMGDAVAKVFEAQELTANLTLMGARTAWIMTEGFA